MSRLQFKIFLFLIFTLGATLLSLHAGPVDISWNSVLSFIFNHSGITAQDSFIIGNLRLPRTLCALFVGATLGVTGLVLQTLLQNPLAEPYTLGLSGGSAFGSVVAIILSLEPEGLWIPLLSTVGCFLAVTAVLSLGRRKLNFESRSLILFGVMVSLFFGALVVTGLAIISPQKLQSALLWLLGEFGTSRDVWIYKMMPVFLIFLIFFWWRAPVLNALNLGEARTLSLGYSPSRERIIFIAVCTLATSLSVSIAGLVGFIGLVSPHIARRTLKTSSHRVLVATSALIGAGLLTLADGLGRILAGTTEIPAGSLAALMGAPVLIYLLMDQRHAQTE